MMLTHHPFTTREFIQRVAKLLGLTHRKVGSALHPVVLTLKQSLSAGLFEECKRLREYPGKRRRQQCIENPGHRGRGILDYPEHRAQARSRGRAILDRLKTKERTCGGEHLGNRCTR